MNTISFPALPVLLASVAATALLGCSHERPAQPAPSALAPAPNKVQIITQTQYDENQRPVYVLPRFATGWRKATVNHDNGEYDGPEYVSKLVSPGYWTTQEEAERAGRPYISMGKDGPVPPGSNGVADMARTDDDSSDVDVADLERRVAKLENAVPSEPASPPDPDSAAQLAARLQALEGQMIPPAGDVTVKNRPADDPGPSAISVPTDPGAPPVAKPGETSIVIPPSPPNQTESYQVPLAQGQESLTVRYIDNLTAIIRYGGEEKTIHLSSPTEKIHVTVK